MKLYKQRIKGGCVIKETPFLLQPDAVLQNTKFEISANTDGIKITVADEMV